MVSELQGIQIKFNSHDYIDRVTWLEYVYGTLCTVFLNVQYTDDAT